MNKGFKKYNKFYIDNNMKVIIKLYGGQRTTIDIIDMERVLKYTWYCMRSRGDVYARGNVNGDKMLLHRYIMRPNMNMVVDHINKKTLDNTRNNLRVCTIQDNSRNMRKHSDGSGIYKGVYKIGNKYISVICVGYKSIHLGTFKTPHEAALKYNKAAIKYFGGYASLNKIKRGN